MNVTLDKLLPAITLAVLGTLSAPSHAIGAGATQAPQDAPLVSVTSRAQVQIELARAQAASRFIRNDIGAYADATAELVSSKTRAAVIAEVLQARSQGIRILSEPEHAALAPRTEPQRTIIQASQQRADASSVVAR